MGGREGDLLTSLCAPLCLKLRTECMPVASHTRTARTQAILFACLGTQTGRLHSQVSKFQKHTRGGGGGAHCRGGRETPNG